MITQIAMWAAKAAVDEILQGKPKTYTPGAEVMQAWNTIGIMDIHQYTPTQKR